MLTQTIMTNLTQSKLSSIIMRSEEQGRKIAFSVIDEAGDPVDLTGYDMKFMLLKPDDNVVYADAPGGVVTQTAQMTTAKGTGYYCIRIMDDDTVIYSGQGRVLVDDHVIDDDTLNSISEIDGLIFPDDFATENWVIDYVDQHTGSDVIANPDTPPTDTLETVTIGETTYDIIHPAEDESGNPIELTDAAAAPLVKCVSAITGSQDLHGYDKPWVGGAGKNKALVSSDAQDDIRNSSVSYSLENGFVLTSTAPFASMRLAFPNLTVGETYTVQFRGFSDGNYRRLLFSNNNNTWDSDTYGSMFVTNEDAQYSKTITATSSTLYIIFYPQTSGSSGPTMSIYEFMISVGSTATTYEPYSNICPITAYNQCTISIEDENEVVQQTSTATFSQSIYQGNADFVGGKARATWGYIASYNGETLPGEWISSMDEYAPGTAPTSGAQVAYELASPTEETITPTNLPIKSLFGYNHIESSTGSMSLTYIKEAYNPIIESAEQADNDLVRVTAAYNAASLSNTDITINYQDYDALVIYVNDALTQCGTSSYFTKEYLDYCRANNRTLTFFPFGSAYVSYNILTNKLEYAGDNNQGFHIIRIDGINFRR